MRKKYYKNSFSPWMKQFRAICGPFILPITIFQGIRTILFPTIFDVLLLGLLILLVCAIKYDWI
ncbi:hypothetical protein ABES25_13855 [Bacillus gobiensis]|uniref:hypothetical protein n=1 Tax=Bacillus gobiensis TaxID=1441095 RepID=UPI003D1E3F45